MLSLARLELPNTWPAATKERDGESKTTQSEDLDKLTTDRKAAHWFARSWSESVNMPQGSGSISANTTLPNTLVYKPAKIHLTALVNRGYLSPVPFSSSHEKLKEMSSYKPVILQFLHLQGTNSENVPLCRV